MGVAIPQIITEDRASGALVVDGSLRFDKTKTQYLRRTISTPTSANTWTFSCWIKRNSITYSEYQYIFSYDSTASRGLAITASIDGNPDCFYIYDGANLNVGTARKVRDASAWYHLVLRCSSGTATLYLNGESSPYITAAATMPNMSNGQTMGIGLLVNSSILPLDAQLSNLYFIDGQALDPSYFGYTDPLTNTWRPKKLSSSVAFGTNGFYLPFDGSAPIGQDRSGNNNNWTPVNFGGSNTLEKATGALPILNTDGGGKVARVGVRTDSSASSLVLALPLVGSTLDFSNTVNSGSTTKTITVNGSPTGNSTTTSNFYSQSYKFAGSDSFGCGTSSDFQMTGDFTLECWIYPVDTTDRSVFVTFDGSNYFAFNVQPGTGFNIYPSGGATNITDIVPYTNGWQHIAMVRSGSSIFIFLNGRRSSTTITNSSTIGYNNQTFYVGGLGTQSTGSYNGYIQDVRVYKGLAKYTSNFIPASTDPDILPDTPSGVSYTSNLTQITDGAVAFDGSGDWLSLPTSADFTCSSGTNFTFEAFIYPTSVSDTTPFGIGNNAGFAYRIISGSPYLYIAASGGILNTGTIAANKWTHIAITRNSGTLYSFIDGILVGSVANSGSFDGTQQNFVGAANLTGAGSPGYTFTGQISNAHWVNGTALYTSNFTPPTGPISSVANTKLLCCKSNSSATAADVTPGTITANGNAAATNFNPFTVNINAVRGQESGWATWNPLTSPTNLTNGNLSVVQPSTTAASRYSTIGMFTGKWYWEIEVVKYSNTVFGVRTPGAGTLETPYDSTGYGMGWRNSGGFYIGGSNTGTGSMSVAAGDVLGLVFNADTGTLQFYKNGIFNNTLTSSSTYLGQTWHAGSQDSSGGNSDHNVNFGQKPFKFPPPAGFQPLALANTPRPSIVRPDQYVGVTTYTGNGGTQSINVGFKPDFVWIKNRTVGRDHRLFDTVRGIEKELRSSATDAEATDANSVTAFTSSGFSVGSNTGINESSSAIVAWAWKAGGNSNTYNINDVGYATASAAGLTAGTITPTGASVNTKSGFSIITYAGSQGSTFEVPHGLGKIPAFVITKARNASDNWGTYYTNNGVNTNWIELNTTNGQGTNNGSLTGGAFMVFSSTTLQIATSAYANGASQMVAYCWSEIPGFSKFGSYTSNNSTDGPVIITGFRPKYVLVKCSSSTGDWIIEDATRSSYNVIDARLFANDPSEELSNGNGNIDFLSNGFKLRNSHISMNTTAGTTYIYAAFAETPSFNLYGAQANAR